MQLESMLMFLLMLIVIPILAISANDTAFFIIFAAVLAIAALKSIYNALFDTEIEPEENGNEIIDDIEEQIDLDMRRLGTGFNVVKGLIIVLFFVYCTFYLNFIWLKVLSSLVILYWLVSIKDNLTSDTQEDAPKRNIFSRALFIIVNISSLVIISFSAYNKFNIFK